MGTFTVGAYGYFPEGKYASCVIFEYYTVDEVNPTHNMLYEHDADIYKAYSTLTNVKSANKFWPRTLKGKLEPSRCVFT